jgi:hypothetical protein
MDNKPSKEISRRDAMKILGAAIGAVALANVPSKWNTPELAAGVLPAHAQTSVGAHTLTPGPDDPAANYCFPLNSTVTITPPTPGILMRYVITTSPGVLITSPAALTGTVPTDGSGIASLDVTVDSFSFTVGSTVTVTWTFENPSDGSGSGAQVFTSAGSGC